MNGRGGGIRTHDYFLAVPNRALYQAELRPVPANSAEDMAVCAYKLAFLQLRDRDCTRATTHHRADGTDFLVAGKVIPVHHPHREYLPAIYARHTLFECSHPCPRLQHPCTLAHTPRRLSALVVVATVVGPATFAAIGKLASPRIVKFARCFPQPAHRAASEKRCWRNVLSAGELGDWLLMSPFHHDAPVHLPQPAR
jgi:hypothetical protein